VRCGGGGVGRAGDAALKCGGPRGRPGIGTGGRSEPSGCEKAAPESIGCQSKARLTGPKTAKSVGSASENARYDWYRRRVASSRNGMASAWLMKSRRKSVFVGGACWFSVSEKPVMSSPGTRNGD